TVSGDPKCLGLINPRATGPKPPRRSASTPGLSPLVTYIKVQNIRGGIFRLVRRPHPPLHIQRQGPTLRARLRLLRGKRIRQQGGTAQEGAPPTAHYYQTDLNVLRGDHGLQAKAVQPDRQLKKHAKRLARKPAKRSTMKSANLPSSTPAAGTRAQAKAQVIAEEAQGDTDCNPSGPAHGNNTFGPTGRPQVREGPHISERKPIVAFADLAHRATLAATPTRLTYWPPILLTRPPDTSLAFSLCETL
ncbi:hypothetical protein VOLCADRAFT_93171, partial [Volvox carteri f. nagariensis]